MLGKGISLCHVCGKEKKPYVVFVKDDIFSWLQHEQAREDGEICQRCDQYHAMTGEFKDATEEEFELAIKESDRVRIIEFMNKRIQEGKKQSLKDELKFLDGELNMYYSLDYNKIEINMIYWEKRLKDRIKQISKTIKTMEGEK